MHSRVSLHSVLTTEPGDAMPAPCLAHKNVVDCPLRERNKEQAGLAESSGRPPRQLSLSAFSDLGIWGEEG